MSAHSQPTDADAALFGNRFVTEEVPSREFPVTGMTPQDALRLVGEDLALEGDPARNLATFVTTWMEPQAQQIIADEPAPQFHRSRRISRARPRSSSAASGCSPTSSMRPARRPVPEPRDRPRRSCSAVCP